jgi:biopolymer transport protein ExbD
MKLLDDKPKKAILNITPLIDVLFILIIFFVVSSTFLEQPGIKLELPKAQTGESQRVEKLVLYISTDEKLFLNNTQIEIDDLGEKLQQLMPESSDKSLIINADKVVPHGLVVQVMDIARGNGVKKLVIATEQKN